jgi:hypothetical protein
LYYCVTYFTVSLTGLTHVPLPLVFAVRVLIFNVEVTDFFIVIKSKTLQKIKIYFIPIIFKIYFYIRLILGAHEASGFWLCKTSNMPDDSCLMVILLRTVGFCTIGLCRAGINI